MNTEKRTVSPGEGEAIRQETAKGERRREGERADRMFERSGAKQRKVSSAANEAKPSEARSGINRKG